MTNFEDKLRELAEAVARHERAPDDLHMEFGDPKTTKLVADVIRYARVLDRAGPIPLMAAIDRLDAHHAEREVK